jgi:hypothetical protein
LILRRIADHRFLPLNSMQQHSLLWLSLLFLRTTAVCIKPSICKNGEPIESKMVMYHTRRIGLGRPGIWPDSRLYRHRAASAAL